MLCANPPASDEQLLEKASLAYKGIVLILVGKTKKHPRKRRDVFMVPEAGIEPACLSARDFKSLAYTIPPLGLAACSIMSSNFSPYNSP